MLPSEGLVNLVVLAYTLEYMIFGANVLQAWYKAFTHSF